MSGEEATHVSEGNENNNAPESVNIWLTDWPTP